MKKKIVYVLHGLAAGGTEAFVLNVVSHLDRKKYDITFILALDDNGKTHQFHEDNVLEQGIKIYRTCDLDGIKKWKLHYEKLTSSFVFKEPLRIINERSILLDNQVKQIENIIKNKKQSEKERYVKLVSKLDTLSPLKTLPRGYSIIEQKGKIINSVKELQEGNEIDIQMIDGKAKAKII